MHAYSVQTLQQIVYPRSYEARLVCKLRCKLFLQGVFTVYHMCDYSKRASS